MIDVRTVGGCPPRRSARPDPVDGRDVRSRTDGYGDAVAETDHVPPAPTWQELVAIGRLAGDLSEEGIVRYAAVTPAVAAAAIEAATAAGVVTDHGPDEASLVRLVADLPLERAAFVHAAVARHLLAQGPERLLDAVGHARSAGLPLDEIVSMADRGGRMSLALGDYRSAKQLIELAVELDASDDFVRRGWRLCELADASRGVGPEAEARRLLVQAAQLGELANEPSLVAAAAVAYSTPCDWNDGDPQAVGLLHRAESLDLGADDRIAVRAARAAVEMRIPLLDEQTHQIAWVTRPAVAQPLADAALAEAASCSDDVRLLALLAWRSTHRGPSFLVRRREVSAEALDLAQRLRHPRRLVDAAGWMAVDALESGDRARFDECLAVASWVAARDGSPAVEWRALTIACGAAHLDGDLERAVDLAGRARAVGEANEVPGWFGFDLVMATQVVDDRDLLDDMTPYLIDDEAFPIMANPFARALTARFFLRHGRADAAERSIRRAHRQLEDESAYLLLCSRLAMVAGPLGLHDLCHDLVARLTPWSEHVAVDSHGWFLGGPVSLPLAVLHHALGDDDEARRHLEHAEPLAGALHDVRTMGRIAALRAELADVPTPAGLAPLTSRERDVLRLIVAGETNPAIAERLSYSLSTIRMDTVAIYRKLGVRGRADAAVRAVELGLH